MDFIAMDYETANRKRASACSVALVVVRDNQVIDSFYSLINPETEFDRQNIRIHGITPEMVADAPNFATMWPHIQSFFSVQQIVAAHNSPFDVSVLKHSLQRYGVKVPHYQVIDTVKTSRKFFPNLPNHRLDTVSVALEIPLPHHHHALADAYACAEILVTETQQFGEGRIRPFMKLTT
ncbi:3'-5' exonuclease [Lacticaseibacillus brantae]|uniref:DNA polymerase III polC-type n=1 Tax=Lacticaseibacillus brantae DSM 23927 TaxID=1423727 RepID=A0A0R2AZA0_9LACO|nr:3'-5' exonuclease [Lacticaseibacillus brantae]KRM72400.1 DNA polymerase III, epsilon subunit related 3-5 exonuclease [Lacticaseibacillus brantae DSM 23927]